MALGYDNYSTSFQSLYSPVGVVQSNYSYVNPGNGNVSGAGANGNGSNGAAYPGVNTNIHNYYTGFYDPLANQMTQENLLKHEKENNDYYARPIAPHIKDDNTGTILGTIATALSTLALIAALRKGKAPAASGRLSSNGGAPIRTNTVYLNNPPYASANAPGYKNNFLNWLKGGYKGKPTGAKPSGGAAPTGGASPSGGSAPTGGTTPPGTSIPGGNSPAPTSGITAQPVNPAPASGSGSGASPKPTGSNPTTAPQPQSVRPALPQHTQRVQNALDKQAAAMNLPSSGQVYTTPYVRPALPQHSQRVQNALDKQAAAMNMPSSGQVYTTPYVRPALPQHSQKIQAALDKQEAAMNLPSSGKVYEMQ